MTSDLSGLTVAVCTHNRSLLLGPLIERIGPLQEKGVNVLVVDNSSLESEKQKVAEIASANSVNLVRSSPPGLSRARNKAIEICGTDLLAYLDDDALPEPEWAQAIVRGFLDPRVGFVAGKIKPGWPKAGRPDWLPDDFIGCLSVLDLGSNDRPLAEHEHAYGANMAFRVAALRECGGFDESLGRSGSVSLLSNEELAVQRKVRASGYSGSYVASAEVIHLIEPERLSRHWFLARMAWQGVSDAIMGESISQDELSIRLLQSADNLGIKSTIEKALQTNSPLEFSKSLQFVRDTSTYFLSATSMADAVKVGTSDVESESVEYDESPQSQPCPPGTRTLFFDGWPGHHYLYEKYALLENSAFVIADGAQWFNEGRSDLEFLDYSVNEGVESLVFLTLDPYVYGAGFDRVLEFLERLGPRLKIFGILHKLPSTNEEADRLAIVAAHVRLIVLERSLQLQLEGMVGTNRCDFLPHHAVFEDLLVDRNSAKRQLNLPTEKYVVSLIGELREGKGVDRLLHSLEYLSEAVKQSCVFILCGKASSVDPEYLRRQFSKHNVEARIVSGTNGESYKYVSDPEMATYISASDVGLLLYEGLQKECMSGILPNYVICSTKIVASRGSLVGRVVAENDLGILANIEKPIELALAISVSIDIAATGDVSVQREAYRNLTSTKSTIEGFSQILQIRR